MSLLSITVDIPHDIPREGHPGELHAYLLRQGCNTAYVVSDRTTRGYVLVCVSRNSMGHASVSMKHVASGSLATQCDTELYLTATLPLAALYTALCTSFSANDPDLPDMVHVMDSGVMCGCTSGVSIADYMAVLYGATWYQQVLHASPLDNHVLSNILTINDTMSRQSHLSLDVSLDVFMSAMLLDKFNGVAENVTQVLLTATSWRHALQSMQDDPLLGTEFLVASLPCVMAHLGLPSVRDKVWCVRVDILKQLAMRGWMAMTVVSNEGVVHVGGGVPKHRRDAASTHVHVGYLASFIQKAVDFTAEALLLSNTNIPNT
jgi:hypothetical protein